ncbi:MAG: glycoside hydrolase family 88 protein [Clostridia bacterium]|nr:glycoside hydrolase family 88 protein [Clostridia bacterium]
MLNNLSKSDVSFIEETWQKIKAKLEVTTVKSRNKIPYTTRDGVHDDQADLERGFIYLWTNGFWAGLNMLMYAETKEEKFLETAKSSEKHLDRIFKNVFRMDHDVGFLWHLSAGAIHRLTGSEESLHRALTAAMILASRYNPDGNFIRVWDNKGRDGWTIIDCMMNINLLYFATEKFQDNRFKSIAMRYADMAMRDHVREDGSVIHVVEHALDKPDTVVGYPQGQGYSPDSCWSRGQSWAVYGFVLSYIHTGKEEYLQTAIKTADYFIEQVKQYSYLPVVDFKAPKEPVYYDSTAGAICACGLIEIAKITKNSQYLTEAINILKALDKNFASYSLDEDALLLMGSESYRKGIHIPIIYGDFFFVEAILKLKGSSFLIW